MAIPIPIPKTSITINTTMTSDSNELNYDIKCIINASQTSYTNGDGNIYIGDDYGNYSCISVYLAFYDHTNGNNIRYISSTGSILLTIRKRYLCVSIK